MGDLDENKNFCLQKEIDSKFVVKICGEFGPSNIDEWFYLLFLPLASVFQSNISLRSCSAAVWGSINTAVISFVWKWNSIHWTNSYQSEINALPASLTLSLYPPMSIIVLLLQRKTKSTFTVPDKMWLVADPGKSILDAHTFRWSSPKLTGMTLSELPSLSSIIQPSNILFSCFFLLFNCMLIGCLHLVWDLITVVVSMSPPSQVRRFSHDGSSQNIFSLTVSKWFLGRKIFMKVSSWYDLDWLWTLRHVMKQLQQQF